MKTYERMARDVLQRIKENEKTRRRQRQTCFRGAIALACAAVLVLTSVMMAGKERPAPSVSDGVVTTPDDGRVFASVMQKVYFSDGGKRETAMQVSQGIRYRLRVFDLRGMTPSQVETLFDEQRRLMEAELGAEVVQGASLRSSVQRMDNVLLSSLSTTGFSLGVMDWTKVTGIKGECSSGYGKVEFAVYAPALSGQTVEYTLYTENTGETLTKEVYDNGQCWLYGQGVALSGDLCQKADLTIMWKPGRALLEALDAEPATPLSAFSDTLTITVSYQDGTAEEHAVHVRFSDDGGVDAVYEGVTRGE